MQQVKSKSRISDLTEQTFRANVIDHPEPILIDFWAPWCAPCRAMAPVLNEIAAGLDGEVRVAKVNVDEQPRLATALGIRGIPTLVLMNGSTVLDSVTGVVPASRLVAQVRARLTAAKGESHGQS